MSPPVTLTVLVGDHTGQCLDPHVIKNLDAAIKVAAELTGEKRQVSFVFSAGVKVPQETAPCVLQRLYVQEKTQHNVFVPPGAEQRQGVEQELKFFIAYCGVPCNTEIYVVSVVCNHIACWCPQVDRVAAVAALPALNVARRPSYLGMLEKKVQSLLAQIRWLGSNNSGPQVRPSGRHV